ncbi:MAG: mannosyl-3-phosphoglycerate phosphatase [Rhodomicrobium sp.]|nr:MAG: mannosyl-3-phosphoglycerate phosphatase [Rhodomicrobium sp.]
MTIFTTCPAVVFTDLDGCLLDHHDYDHLPAKPARSRLKELGIPLIPVTSKTAAEIRALDIDFGSVPLISENGMVIDLPPHLFSSPHDKGGPIFAGKPYNEILAFLQTLPASLRASINGFHDMSAAEIAAVTGLKDVDAVRAKARQASEPFLWQGDEAGIAELSALATANGFKLTQGGRFYHLLSEGGKDWAVNWVIDHLKLIRPELLRTDLIRPDRPFHTIALGDSANDKAMLASVDYGIIIPNPGGSGLVISDASGRIIRAPHVGPRGWNAAIMGLLDELDLDTLASTK